jgi:hypothetical protein
MKKYKWISFLFLIIIFLGLIILNFDFFSYDTDTDFVQLIKTMAIKNHDNPNLFLEKYQNASSDEEKLKIILTNNFYECVYNNSLNIKTRTDINLYCGHFIKF